MAASRAAMTKRMEKIEVRTALALALLLLISVFLYTEVQRQHREQNVVWTNCEHAAVTRFPPDDGLFRRESTNRKIDDSIEGCFLSHGYKFHAHPPCGPSFPSRREAPFCYAPVKWYDRQLFWLGQWFVEIQ